MRLPKPFFSLKKVWLKSIIWHKNYNSGLWFGANFLYTARLICRANGMCPLLENVISKLAKICHLYVNRSRYLQSQKREGIWSCWLPTKRHILFHKAGPLTGSSILLLFWNGFWKSVFNIWWKQHMETMYVKLHIPQNCNARNKCVIICSVTNSDLSRPSLGKNP